MKNTEIEKINLDELDGISGGTVEEFDEIRNLLRTKYDIVDDNKVAMKQIERILNSDMKMDVFFSKSVYDSNRTNVRNTYKVGTCRGTEISHAEAMDLIKASL